MEPLDISEKAYVDEKFIKEFVCDLSNLDQIPFSKLALSLHAKKVEQTIGIRNSVKKEAIDAAIQVAKKKKEEHLQDAETDLKEIEMLAALVNEENEITARIHNLVLQISTLSSKGTEAQLQEKAVLLDRDIQEIDGKIRSEAEKTREIMEFLKKQRDLINEEANKLTKTSTRNQ